MGSEKKQGHILGTFLKEIRFGTVVDYFGRKIYIWCDFVR